MFLRKFSLFNITKSLRAKQKLLKKRKLKLGFNYYFMTLLLNDDSSSLYTLVVTSCKYCSTVYILTQIKWTKLFICDIISVFPKLKLPNERNAFKHLLMDVYYKLLHWNFQNIYIPEIQVNKMIWEMIRIT